MRICVIAYHFPPLNAIGALRPLRLANHAVAQGHEVTVICVSPGSVPKYYRVDADLSSRIDPRIRVLRAPTLQLADRLVKLRNRIWKRPSPGAAAAAAPAASGSGASEGGGGAKPVRGLFARIMEAAQAPFNVPDSEASFILTGFLRYLQAYGFRPPNRLYVTGPPWSPMCLASLVARLFGVPLTVDYRDPWNHNISEKRHFAGLKAALERGVLRSCKAAIFNTARMREQYRELGWLPEFEARSTVIYNGIDDDLIREVQAARQDAAAQPDAVTIVHAGTLYAFRMPQHLAEFLAATANAKVGGRDQLYRFVGALYNAPLQAAFAARSASARLEFGGKVSAHRAKVELAGASVILVLQLETTIQLPAKVFECALMGKPILCVAEKDSETADFIRKYGLGEVVSPPFRESMAEVLERILASQGKGAEGREAILAAYRGADVAEKMLRVVMA